ncbi:hypothetical protein EVA_02859 [gut metagenome]|uniref:Uncharacterized protein n=1 Tax=gut metagenome TaxID=749906 RepID=J9GN75_9ZZZZ
MVSTNDLAYNSIPSLVAISCFSPDINSSGILCAKIV